MSQDNHVLVSEHSLWLLAGFVSQESTNLISFLGKDQLIPNGYNTFGSFYKFLGSHLLELI